jgi:transcriptional regulator with XRE-family HTH domain
MSSTLQLWRKRSGLTQVEAAAQLAVSQPYLSLLEKGVRPLTPALRGRMKAAASRTGVAADRAPAQLSALGYPGFAHVPPARPKPNPGALLLSILVQPDADSRVVEALPWLVRRFAGQLPLPSLVRQAKLQNLQNRLGFVLQTAGVQTPELSTTLHELERARLLQEATLCWDSMPAATRDWIRINRSPLAEHWNVLTTLQTEGAGDAG